MSDTTPPAPPTQPTPPPSLNIEAGGVVVGLAAGISALLVARGWSIPLSFDSAPEIANSVGLARWIVPHLIVVALVAAQFARLADLAAVIVGIAAFLFSALMVIGTFHPIFFTIGFVQIVMVLAALYDLWASQSRTEVPVQPRHRALGLIAPLIIGGIGVVNLAGARSQELAKRQRAAARDAVSRDYQRYAWTGNAQIHPLIELAKCIERFRGDSVAGPYPRSLRELYHWSVKHPGRSSHCGTNLFADGDTTVAYFSNHDPHHRVQYAPPRRGRYHPWRSGGFTLASEAVWDSIEDSRAAGQPGTYNYFLDTTGNIHVTHERRLATAADTVLPDYQQKRDGSGYEWTTFFLPRQRWGIRSQLPRFSLGVSDDTPVGQEVMATMDFSPADATDSLASIAISWRDSGRVIVVPFTKARSVPQQKGGSVQHWMLHAYSDTGLKVVRVIATTRSGDRFEMVDSARIVPRRKAALSP